ncbi:hypothetical protein [Pelomonas aquatica]|uniref:hypothetical protein n=1 Tax=Pelomonas aquatica TaxID=431058 RepID=UPI00286C4397|nr:hypothetical protein [Pelomonas aquatica]
MPARWTTSSSRWTRSAWPRRWRGCASACSARPWTATRCMLLRLRGSADTLPVSRPFQGLFKPQ